MPKLVIFRGNSGSGKTSTAFKLQDKLGPNTMFISHDMVRMKILNTWGDEGVRRSLPLMTELMKYGAVHSAVTILEGILPTDRYTPLFEAAAEIFGTENIAAYHYVLPFEETLARHATKPNHADFGEADLRRWWKEGDFLPNIPETILGPELSADDVVEMVCRRLAEMENST